MINKRVVVTGIGPMSSLGKGCKETWESIINLRLNIVRNKYSLNSEKWGEFYIKDVKAKM